MKKRSCYFVLIILIGLVPFMLLQPVIVQANGNDILVSSVHYEVQGDVTAAGVGLRGTGTGSIDLNAIPASASVYRAFLYWSTLGNANTNTAPTLNGEPVQGQLIGTSGDTCWGVQHNYVYRADVTDLVDGNGTYTIAGLPASITAGNDSQGASLVVVYTDNNLPYRTIVINDGAVSLNYDRTAYTNILSGFTINQPLTNAHVTYLIGDGQSNWDSGNIRFNDNPLASNVFSGVDGQFWGTHTFDVTALVAGSPVTTTISNHDPNNPASPDCLVWAATIFSVTSPVPNVNNQHAQFYSQTLYGDVTATGVGLRGRGQGNLVVNGVPRGVVVARSFLYWATIGNSGQYTSPQLSGTAVSGEVIGISADTCWGVPRNYVYRADVTNLVKGNGTYTITGLPNDLATGNDSQGASLVLIYYGALYRTIIINDGAVTLDLTTHSYTDRLGPFTADQPGAQAHVTYLVGDGQSRWDSGNVNFEGSPLARNVFNGVDGDFWGTLSFDVTGKITEPEATTTISNNDPANPSSPDCLLWAATVLAVETEPPQYEFSYFFPNVAK